MMLAGRISWIVNLALGCFCYLAANAMAADYYLIEDAGKTYSDFYEKPKRIKSMEDLWGKVIPSVIKAKTLSNDDSPYYKPTNGDVGILVADLGLKGKKRIILDVAGNYILINKDGVKKVGQQTYQEFLFAATSVGSEMFGLKLGVTTPEEAVKILEQNGASFNDKLSCKGFADIPVVHIDRYKYLPVINGYAPNKAYICFVDNKLYQVAFEWLRKSDSLTSVEEFKDVSRSIYNGVNNKYKWEDRCDVDHLQMDCHSWLNPQRHITFTSFSDGSYNVRHAVLTYNDSSLLKKANQIKKEIERKELEEKNKEDAKISNQL